ncbi:hypothetical protein ES703_78821 [subsurface metagenome]
MKNNTGEAILILGIIYFLTTLKLRWWQTLLLCILIGLALLTWSMHFGEKEQKDLLKYSVIKIKLEIELMKAQTQFYVARGAAFLRGLKPN